MVGNSSIIIHHHHPSRWIKGTEYVLTCVECQGPPTHPLSKHAIHPCIEQCNRHAENFTVVFVICCFRHTHRHTSRRFNSFHVVSLRIFPSHYSSSSSSCSSSFSSAFSSYSSFLSSSCIHPSFTSSRGCQTYLLLPHPTHPRLYIMSIHLSDSTYMLLFFPSAVCISIPSKYLEVGSSLECVSRLLMLILCRRAAVAPGPRRHTCATKCEVK